MATTLLEQDVAILKRDIESFLIIINRLDVAIEKITTLSTDINKLVAIHSIKIELLEKMQEKSAVEEKELRKELEEQIKEDCSAILKELKLVRVDYESLDIRMKKIERLFWVITGAATIVGFVASFLTENFTALFSKMG